METKKIPPTTFIKAIGLANAWAKAVKYVMKHGAIIKTEYGNFSRDVCSLIEIQNPFLEPMLHPQFPTKQTHLKEYIKQWERDYDWKKQGFEYNYMDRIINYSQKIDQLKIIRERLIKNETPSRRLQAITWHVEIDNYTEHPPCLQRLFFRKLNETQIELHCMWRSRDCYGAFNSNLIGLLFMVRKEILEPCSLEIVKLVDFCNSLHIYEQDWEAAKNVKQIALNPQQAYK